MKIGLVDYEVLPCGDVKDGAFIRLAPVKPR
jgi:hypothetical protein